MQSCKYQREDAFDRTRHGGTDRAQRICNYGLAVSGILFYRDVSAHLYVTLGSSIYTDYHREREKLLHRAFVMKKIGTRPSFVFAEHGYAQHGGSE